MAGKRFDLSCRGFAGIRFGKRKHSNDAECADEAGNGRGRSSDGLAMVCTGEYSRAEAERCEAMIGKEKAMMRLAEAEEKRGLERARNRCGLRRVALAKN